MTLSEYRDLSPRRPGEPMALWEADTRRQWGEEMLWDALTKVVHKTPDVAGAVELILEVLLEDRANR